MDNNMIKTIREVRDLHEDELMQYPNVVGIGTGYKKINGQRSEELCIVVSVKKKVPDGELRSSEKLPRSLKVNLRGSTVDVAVDVEETGEMTNQAASYKGSIRPLQPGYSIGDISSAGTGGIFVVQNGKTYLLTNSHVAISNGKPVSLLQPGGYDGGTSSDFIGSAAQWHNLSTTGSNYIDAALIDVSSVSINPDYPELPTIKGHYNTLYCQWHFQKVGRTTGLTEGRIDEVDYTVVSSGYKYEHLVKMYTWNKPISLPGDSGCVWITDDNYAGIHHIGGNNVDVAYGSPIGNVLKFFNASILSGSRHPAEEVQGNGWAVDESTLEKILSESRQRLSIAM